ncbi:MAG: C45 family peptidase [Myxococcota bacterium]|nr:C45 family peptidase [Myxococcota bacterium]
MRVLKLEGSPKSMGECFGETCRSEIQEFYALRVQNAIQQAKKYGARDLSEEQVLAVAKECLNFSEGFDPDGHKELVAMARAANLAPEQVWALNGLTDLRDILAWSDLTMYMGGCSSFIVKGDKTSNGKTLCGQTWDLATDNMPFVLGVHRVPSDAPQTWSLTTAGCLSLIGMNEQGISIGTTNLRTRDAQRGVCYLSIIHKVLSCRDIESAIDTVTNAVRAGGHYYYICDATGKSFAVECSAKQYELTSVDQGHHVECNHILSDKLLPLEADTPKNSSLCRISRMNQLISSAPPESLSPEKMIEFLSDHEDGPGAICRHDLDDVSSNGAVVMSPEIGLMKACHGYPCEAQWVDLVS